MKTELFRWILSIGVSIICLSVSAQNNSHIDSLTKQLKSNPTDTTKIDLLISLHQAFANQDSAKSLSFIHQAISLSEKTSDKKRLARSYLKLAYYHDRKGDLSKSRYALDQIEKELQNFDDDKIKAAFFMQSGIIYYFEGVYDKAVNNIWEALTRYEKMGDSVTVASCNLLIGESNRKLGNLDQALAYFEKALDIYKSNGDAKGIAMATGNIGIVYKSKSNYPKALEYYKESLEFNQKNGLWKKP